MALVPNPYFINIELFWPNGTRPNASQISLVKAFDVNGATVTEEGQSGYDSGSGGWQAVYMQNIAAFYPPRERPNLRFQVVSTSNQVVHTTQVFNNIAHDSTVKIIIGQSDSLDGGSTWRVGGTVRWPDGSAITQGTVRVYDITNGSEALLGTVPLGGTGNYVVTYEAAQFESNGTAHSAPNLVVRVYDPTGTLLKQSEIFLGASQNQVIDLVVAPPVVPDGYRVYGDVKNQIGLPVSGILVQAYHVAWTTQGIEEILLGAVLSQGDGSYDIPYTPPTPSNPGVDCGSPPNEINLLVYVKEGSVAVPGSVLSRSAPVSPAAKQQRVDVSVEKSSSTTTSEYARIHDGIEGCLGATDAARWETINQIGEREDYLSIVARSSGISEELLRAYIAARRITGQINDEVWDPTPGTFSPEIVYGLVRQGLGSTLTQLLEVDPSEFHEAVVLAIERGFVSSTLEERLRDDASEPLQEEWSEVLGYYLGAGDDWQAEVLSLVIADESKRKQIGQRYYAFQGVLDDFFVSLTQPGDSSPLLTEDEAKNLSFAFTVYEKADRYFPITRVIYEAKATRGWLSVDDLATVTLQDDGANDGWITYALASRAHASGNFPGDVPGKTDQEKGAIYGQRLYDKFGAVAPQERFVGDLAKAAEEEPELEDVAEFLGENREFDLQTGNLEKYLAEKDLDLDPVVVGQVKQLQRVSRLTTNYAQSATLISLNLDSAVAISRIKEDEFIADHAEALGGLSEARSVYRLAQHYATEVLFTVLRYHRAVNDAGGAIAFATGDFESLVSEIAANNPQKFPNWVTLFGAHNNAASKHCQTVLGPGAYLVDLLRFLRGTPKNMLLRRRPELADIEVTCPNTDKAVPYIDLVNEILEAVVAPHRVTLTGFDADRLNDATAPGADRDALLALLRAQGYLLSERTQVALSSTDGKPIGHREWLIQDEGLRFRVIQSSGSYVALGALQTSSTFDAPDVFPEHFNQAAYDQLATAVFPFQLPLALGKEETNLLLTERRLTRDAILSAFRTDLDIESLVTSSEFARTLLDLVASEETAVLSTALPVHRYWGFTSDTLDLVVPRPENPAAKLQGKWFELLAQVTIFLNRSTLKFKELLDLLELDFVQFAGVEITEATEPPEETAPLYPPMYLDGRLLDIENANYFDFQIENLTKTRARRLSFFLRLAKKWNVGLRELDHYLVQIEGNVVPANLVRVAQVERVRRELGLSFSDALSLFADLDVRRTDRNKVSQFDALYLRGSSSQEEYRKLDEIARGGEFLLATDSDTARYKSYLRAALRLSAEDIDALFTEVFGTEDKLLDVASLSKMARIAAFSRGSKLSVRAFHELRTLLGINPFLEGASSPSFTDRVVALSTSLSEVRRLTKQRLGIPETAYLLQHTVRADDDFELTSEEFANALQRISALAGEVQKAYPVLEQPTLQDVAALLTEVMPAERIARVVTILERPETGDDAYLVRYFVSFVGDAVVGFVTDLLALSEESARAARVWSSLRTSLVARARKARALALAQELFGVAPVAADLLLVSGLTSTTTSDATAIVDWTNALRGGFDSGEESFEALEPAGVRTTRWVVPKDGKYVFIANLSGPGGTVSLALDDGAPLTGTVTGNTVVFDLDPLKAGTVKKLALTFTGTGLKLQLRWQFENADPTPIPVESFVALPEAAYVKASKAARAVIGLRLTPNELEYLVSDQAPAAPPGFTDFVLDRFPTTEAGPALPWSQWSEFLERLELNRTLPLQKTSLFDQWRSGRVFDAAFIASISSWRQDDIQTVLDRLTAASALDFDAPATWKVLLAALSVTQKLDLRAAQIIDLLVDSEPTLVDAHTIRGTVRARYSNDGWREVFKPLRDKLRQRQRDALVGYLTSRPVVVNEIAREFVDANDLFSYFLIDVEMEPDTQISRIRLALNSIQLFVQRGLMGLEGTNVGNEVEKLQRQWTWMQNYRVWEANRKVFLFPENWIEPELRDDKTQFFREFEDDLLQDDVTSDRAQKLLSSYIGKLEEVSHLEVVGMCEEGVFSKSTTGVIHIIGRTRSEPSTYYHRTFQGRQFRDGYFTPWRKVDLEINASVVTPSFFNGRLHLFWTMAQMKQKVANQESQLGFQAHIQLIWTAYSADTGKWLKPRLGKSKVIDDSPATPFAREQGEDQPTTDYYHLRAEPDRCDGVAIEVIKSSPPQWVEVAEAYAPLRSNAHRIGVFRLSAAGEDFAYQEYRGYDFGPNHPSGTALSRNGSGEVDFLVDNIQTSDRFFFQGSTPFFARTPGYYRVVLTNFGHFKPALNKPLVYQTERGAFFGVHHGSRRLSTFSKQETQTMKFQTFHHPVLPELKRRFLAQGPGRLFDRETQALPPADGRYYYNYTNNNITSSGGSYCSGYSNGYNNYGGIYLGYQTAGDSMARGVAQRNFELEYAPGAKSVVRLLPMPIVDFNYGSSFGSYNWELFFHIPLMIAGRLSQEMRFEDAMDWYHFVFDPRRGLSPYERSRRPLRTLPTASRYWNFLPFFGNVNATDSLLETLGYRGSLTFEEKSSLRAVLEDWRNDPFNPHLIARQRIVAYQKSVVMKYLDNLIAWGDQLFRRDTFETINQATQLYILADEILGNRPELVESLTDEPRYTFRELESKGLDVLSNALVDVESLLVGNMPSLDGKQLQGEDPGNEDIRELAFASLYFRIPRNDRLDSYWDTVADRLFKIRNSMNIDGVKRTLALFDPPIDPALLVRAAAAGLDLGNVLAQLNRQLPYYRFNVWTQKATELANEVKSFGQALLSALEKKDAEELSLIRQGHELRMLGLVRRVREDQIKEAEQNVAALQSQRLLAEDRFNDYSSRQFTNDNENASFTLSDSALGLEVTAGVFNTIGGALSGIPQAEVGVFSASISFGGLHLSNIFSAIGSGIGIGANILRQQSSRASTMAGYERRREDWELQKRQAQLEMAQVDKQIVAAEIRVQLAQKELDNHLVQIEQAEEVQTFLKEKFSNKELYQWMVTQLSRTYQQVYKLAHDVAKTAERAFEFELGVEGSNFVRFTYDEGLNQGLLAGEKLGYDIKRMEVAYLEKDKRELEITKSISLASINPEALQRLRESGGTDFELNEILFDLDFPGHYFRRIQAVRLTIPCVTGPYTSVSAKLSLVGSAIRKTATVGEGYAYGGLDDTRFVHDVGGIQSIATSRAQDDSGLFELNFRDERYLPFEGAGVISRWRLDLPTAARQFDYHSISDVVVTISYTARDAGGILKEEAEKDIHERLNAVLKAASENPTGLVRVFSLKQEFPDVLHKLLTSNEANMKILPEHFPFVLRDRKYELGLFEEFVHSHVVLKPTADAEATRSVGIEGTVIEFSGPLDATALQPIFMADVPHDEPPLGPDWSPKTWALSWTSTSTEASVDEIDDILFTVKYTVAAPTT